VERRRERARYRRALRLTAPPGLVAAATERRLAGDWRGACAAALVDVHIDLADVARTYGPGHAARIEGELTGFAPDLLRRFLPRLDGRLLPRATVVLSRFDEPCRDARAGRGIPVLVAALPYGWQTVRQSVSLRVRHELPEDFYDLPDWAWHADAVDSRRWAWGAGPERLPWHSADGTPYPQGTKTPAEQVVDRPAEIERTTALLAAGQATEAFAAFGFAVSDNRERYGYGPELPELLTRMGAALPVARAELIRFERRYRQEAFRAASSPAVVTASAVHRDYSRPHPGPLAFGIDAPADAALLRFGDLGPDDLHPLVHDALFPGRTQARKAPAGHEWAEIRVRCGSGWHTVVATGGHLLTPDHDDEELRREFVLGGLGGPVSGCAAAVQGWRTGRRPIPKDVRKDRQAIFALAMHGDTDGLLARLADGLDPGLRGPGGGTLLHWLAHVDHERVLPVLLAGGLSLEDRDHAGRTPLHAAAESEARMTMGALVSAGADPRARDQLGHTPAEVLAEARRR
jgi:hypothetical protein